HVEFPRKAIKEAHRILKPGGILIITSVMNFPIHAHPSDYWRFTPEGFKSLLQPFDSHYVDFAGEIDFPHTIVGVGCKGFSQEDSLEELAIRIKPWKEMWFNRAGHDWRALITPFVPPIIAHLGMGRKVRSGLRAVSRGVNLWRGSKSPS
ncbi:MAG: class I SAM-dependent methyltransferase, partial [Candidatus Marsarchaeota archaeon]|nr:class I SAM-dependent methyltransferase [Candidatus Marsarchaeota archaeon]